jgi:hypothetical protein
MSTNAWTPVRILLLALVPALAGCGGDRAGTGDAATTPATEMTADAVRVTDVELGNAVGADRRIAAGAETDEFAPSATIYASVATEGTGTSSTLTARWTYEDGQVVDETSQTISPSGPTVTEFHISMADGLPAGNYQVEILLNGASAERKSFRVR